MNGSGKIRSFLLTSVSGGLLILLPIAILILLIQWLYSLLSGVIRPASEVLVHYLGLWMMVADLIILAVFIGVCFLIGMTVKTRLGTFIYNKTENAILKRAPGYSMIKETMLLFLGRKTRPFSSVALVQVYASSTLMTAFVTDQHPDGSYTVFVPTAPNPTSGNIYHLESDRVHEMNITVEQALRTILSCGAGSTYMIEQFEKGTSPSGTGSPAGPESQSGPESATGVGREQQTGPPDSGSGPASDEVSTQ